MLWRTCVRDADTQPASTSIPTQQSHRSELLSMSRHDMYY